MTTKPFKYSYYINERIKSNVLEKTLELYKPKAYKFEKQRDFYDSTMDYSKSINRYQTHALKEGHDPYVRYLFNQASMWYSIHQANLLKEEYRWKNNIKYDCVVRLRSELVIREPIIFKNHDLNKVNYFQLYQPDNMVSDWIGFSNSKNMDIYTSVFCFIQYFYDYFKENTDGIYCNEVLLKKMLDQFNIGYVANGWAIELPI